jgi:hypothetical protein
MRKFTLNTIQKGRLNDISMNQIIGGDFYCPIYIYTQCMAAVRGVYQSCSELPAVTYENCSSLGYVTCTGTYEHCWEWE